MADEVERHERLKIVQEELNRLKKEYIELLEDESNNHDRIKENLKSQKAIHENNIKNIERIHELNREIGYLREKGLQDEKESVNLKKELTRLEEETYAATEKYHNKEKEALELTKEKIKANEENLELLQKQAEAAEAAQKAGEESFKRLTSSFGVTDAWDSTFIGQLEKAVDEGQLGNHLSGISNELSKLPVRTIESGLLKVSEMTKTVAIQQDTATAALSKATGAGGKYDEMIQEVYMANRQFGASFGDAGESIGALYAVLPDFNDYTGETKNNLLATTIQLEKLGVASSQTAGIISTLRLSFGASRDEAISFTKEIAESTGPGRTLQKTMSDLAENSDRLAVYSFPRLGKVVKNLGKISANTKIDMSRLIDIVEQFDTFDDAAKAAGGFNALMGGNFIDPVTLMSLTDMDERLGYLAETTRKTGVEFENLGFYERKSLAEQFGVSVEELGRIWGKSTYELTEYNEEQATLEERSKQARSVQDKFVNVMETFAIAMGPAIELVSTLADKYLELDKKTQNLVAALGFGGVGLGAIAFGLGGTFFKLATAILPALIASMTGTAAATGPVSAGIVGIGKAIGIAGVSMIAGVKGFAIFSGVVLAVGTSAVMAGMGMKLFSEGVVNMLDSLDSDKIKSLGQLYLYSSMFAPVAFAVVPATVAFASSLAGLAGAIAIIDGNKLSDISQTMKSMADMKDTTQYVEAVQETRRMYEVVNKGGDDATEAIKAIIEAQTSAVKGSTGNDVVASVPVTLELGGKVLNDFVIEVVRKQLTVRGAGQ